MGVWCGCLDERDEQRKRCESYRLKARKLEDNLRAALATQPEEKE
jgi:hypothetical protein